MLDAVTQFLDLGIPRISFPQVSMNSVLDIAVISFILYKVMLHIKQNRAGIIFRGIVILLITLGGAYVLNLQVVLRLMSIALNAGIIALIVLYQPELRKALEKIGKRTGTGILPGFESQEKISERTVEAVITASVKMSRVRTGALIAVEREVPLGDLMETGITIDAVVTSELLINIFETKTPLHDGAVVIRHNRVMAATCLFPLTKNEIGTELGTRHRAAVGASEVSDAYIIVISEESGHISIANEGRLYRNVSADEMYEMLSQSLPAVRKADKKTGKSKKGVR
jgi:diadenylate cyclase